MVPDCPAPDHRTSQLAVTLIGYARPGRCAEVLVYRCPQVGDGRSSYASS
jgi:hypothetical protein